MGSGQFKQYVAIFCLIGLVLTASCGQNSAPLDKPETSHEEQVVEEPQDASLKSSTEVLAPMAQQSADPAEEPPAQTWDNHIQKHDEGWVSAVKPIRIKFKHPILEEHAVSDKPAVIESAGVVKIEPAIPFELALVESDVLELRPKQRLASGQIYAIALFAQKISNIPDELAAYHFQIQTLEQGYELHVAGIVPEENSDSMVLTGSVKTWDVVESELIEKSLSATHNESLLTIAWEPQQHDLERNFRIKGIKRNDTSSVLILNYDATELSVDKKGQHSITVPSLTEFEITGIRTYHKPEQYVEISFSENLDRNQNLNGLVTLNEQDARVRVDGSRLLVYPKSKLSGEVPLAVQSSIKSTKKLRLAAGYEDKVIFVSEMPGVRFAGKGSILPPNKTQTVPFEAINVKAVWVTAFKVFENNIAQHIQSRPLAGDYTDSAHGRYLWKKKIALPKVPIDQWQRFDVDVKSLMDKHQGSLINLSLSIDRSMITYPCEKNEGQGDGKDGLTSLPPSNYEGPNIVEQEEQPSWFNQFYQKNNGYVTWEQRRDPCHRGYYTHYYSDDKNIKSSRNFWMTDLGLIVKQGRDKKFHTVVTSIKSGKPLKNATVSFFNYQNQKLISAKTNRDGMAELDSKHPAFYVLAEFKGDKNYLRLPRNEALPTSLFDTSGEKVKKGMKGFIYGERDVWRPGDDIYLTFILQDETNTVPKGHPVSIDFFDPRGTKVLSKTSQKAVGNLYTFTLQTEESSPTGNWRAIVKVGGQYFDKIIKIETIVPNRLKLDITPSENPINTNNLPMRTELFAQWLNGANAKNLRADTELKLRPKKTKFESFGQYHFDDPASSFENITRKVFDGKLDAEGRAAFDLNTGELSHAPGKLRGTFVSRVFEQSGNFSTAIRHFDFLPFENWVGIFVPKGDGYNNSIGRDKDHPVNMVLVNSDGKALANRELEISVYTVRWRWWWDQETDNLANYVRSESRYRVKHETVTTDEKGKASWTLAKNTYNWGRHLIRVCDKAQGHCSGQELYLGWSWSNQVNPDAATQLALATDKERYRVGDIAKIQIPKFRQGRLLYSIENGSQVLAQDWADVKPGAEYFEVPITQAMTPNVYVNAMLILPHEKKSSDAPIRLYGITPLFMDDPLSHLSPELDVPEKVRPQSSFEITVSEKDNRAMNYTLAVVDEGLLGVTGYNIPNPHMNFYKRESLGVLTWDVFDGVVGAYGANLERLLKIGGGKGADDAGRKSQRRFPPVVRFLGAHSLKAGETKTHKIDLPQYMGAVRVMLVASSVSSEGTKKNRSINFAYGKTEKTIQVTQPLTLLATLPRVLGPGEEVELPVNVFVNDKRIKNVNISVEANDLFEVDKENSSLDFDSPGDKIALMRLKVRDKIGAGKVHVSAKAGDEEAGQTIFIESRSPNTRQTLFETKVLQPGEVWEPQLKPNGLIGTNQSSVQISTLPPLNLERRLGYLIRYPHGCVEQTTSAIFPQIQIGKVVNLSSKEKHDIQANVEAAIKKYRRFQNGDGSFSYWPGGNYSNDWASTYVTHFLVQAAKQGYAVPNDMLNRAIKYIKQQATKNNANHDYSRLVRAYQLYVLSSQGQADLASMNRAREYLLQMSKDGEIDYNDEVSRWFIAMAYQNISLHDAAEELLQHRRNRAKSYQYYGYTYGSYLRDTAILLMSMNQHSSAEDAWELAKRVAQSLSSQTWYSTQSVAWALLALSEYAGDKRSQESYQFSVQENDQAWQAIQGLSAITQHEISPDTLTQGQLKVRNDNERTLHVSVSNSGIPKEGREESDSKNLTIDVNFYDLENNKLDVSALPQGRDFVAEVTVDYPDGNGRYQLEDIALTMVFPSGWQIRNERLEGDAIAEGLDYQDIRDDRVLSYFSLWQDYYWSYRYKTRSHKSQTVRVILNASYAGRFYLPGWEVSSMYDDDYRARNIGQWVEVLRENTEDDD